MCTDVFLELDEAFAIDFLRLFLDCLGLVALVGLEQRNLAGLRGAQLFQSRAARRGRTW